MRAALGFHQSWEVIGPFQIGTREAIWGADPLALGKDFFQRIEQPSSLPQNGTTKWMPMQVWVENPNSNIARANLKVDFPEVEWGFLQQVYGWAAFQYQAWAAGNLHIRGPDAQTVVLYTDNVLEYIIDGQHHFGGDFYAFRRAPLVVRLTPGPHRIELRLLRDVRSMGGIPDSLLHRPMLEVTVEAHITTEEVLQAIPDSVVVPDVAGGLLASSLGSVSVRNDHKKAISIMDVASLDEGFHVRMLSTIQVHFQPGQSRPVAFCISQVKDKPQESELRIRIAYRIIGVYTTIKMLTVTKQLRTVGELEPQKITFLHPAGMVSYAILRPPSQKATQEADECLANEEKKDGTLQRLKFPILLQLHGAGVEADSDQVRRVLDPVPDLRAFVLFPTGVTPWCGDDWHIWGSADVQAAINAVPDWISQRKWQGPAVDTEKWIVSGHSNGGQGVWYITTHHPDNVVAAAPVSGYSSIQNYVPYTMWHPMDPQANAVVQASLNNYRHELLLDNVKAIPTFVQHGGQDDNVPAYHARLMHQLSVVEGQTNMRYHELRGKGHWFETVMTTHEMVMFYEKAVSIYFSGQRSSQSPDAFPWSFVVANPAAFGTKDGVKVLSLVDPGRLGRVDIDADHHITTSNIRSFSLSAGYRGAVSVDGHQLGQLQQGTVLYRRGQVWEWQSPANAEGVSSLVRTHVGALDSFLQSSGPFLIQYQQDSASELALQISRNLFQYFAADTVISHEGPAHPHQPMQTAERGNVINLAVGFDISLGLPDQFPIEVCPGRVKVRSSDGSLHEYAPKEQGLAATFLYPGEGGRLNLMVWASEERFLPLAARLVPTWTGAGQPAFVIVSGEVAKTGAAAAFAMGFFDSDWNIARSSYLK